MRKKWVIVLSILIIMVMNIGVVEAANQSNVYVVKAGDSLTVIAKKYKTTVEELKLTNGLQSYSLVAGQKLWVPVMHKVVSGDTLSAIAKVYNSSGELIKRANKLPSNQVNIGQVLKIPHKRMAMQGYHILMTKEEFRDWLFNQKTSRKITLIQQHHTWLPSYKHFKGNNHFQMLEDMETFHKKKGWKTIAQNITTFPDGKVAVSRPLNMAPEGSMGYKPNSVGITIENVGNFDKGHDVMTKEQKDTIVYVTAALSLKFGLSPSIDSITYHHWWKYNTSVRVLDNSRVHEVKSCPGTAFFGGNSTTSAKTYFYPLVQRKMQEISATK